MNTSINNESVNNSAATVSNPTYASIVISDVRKDEDREVNANRKDWYAIYTQIRRLCIIKGSRIRKYAPEFAGNPRKTISFNHGKLVINQEFWQALKPAHKSQLRALTNQIQSLYMQLEVAQA